MSHLIEEYAKSCGVNIGLPFIQDHYFPVIADKYITLDTGSDAQSNAYDHWDIVIKLLKEPLNKNGIKIIQIGSSDCEQVRLIDKKNTDCSYKQTFYIIKKSMLHLGVNTYSTHAASFYNKKIVTIFGNSYPECGGPYWSKKEDIVNISPDFSKTKPSFSPNETNKRINEIKPEDIANQVLKLLNINQIQKFKSVFYGENYKLKQLDVVPNNTKIVTGEQINIRMDKFFDLYQMEELLKRNRCEITTKKTIPIKYLLHKNLIKLNYIADEFDESFISQLNQNNIKYLLVCSNKKTLKEQRIKFFEEKIFLFNKEKIIQKNSKKLKNVDFSKLKINSNKAILNKDEIFNSYYEITRDKEDLYLDLNLLMCYYHDYE